MSDLRRCARCEELKPTSDFNRCSRRADGLQGYCRACQGAHGRARYAERRDAEIARVTVWQAANRAAHLARRAEYRARTAPERAAAKAAWDQAHPDRVRDYCANRRARIAAVPHEDVDRAVVWARDGGVCYLCEQPADWDDWHLDHIIPLSRPELGASHTYANVAVTHPACNQRKHAKVI